LEFEIMPFVIPQALHHRTASRRMDVTKWGAELFQVSEEQFANWRWQMKHQVQSARDVPGALQLTGNEARAFAELEKVFHAGVTPYYVALMLHEGVMSSGLPVEPGAVRLQAFPLLEEKRDSLGVADPLGEVTHSPVKEVVHVYKDRVAFCVAQLCPVYCRYCFRKRRDEEVGLHFNRKIIDEGIAYIASNKNIRDVLITGGDPLIAHDAALDDLLGRLRAIEHVEILRIGTRVPVTLPYRITEELADILAKHHTVWVNTHFNCAEEITPEATSAVDTLLRRGIPVGNQAVLLKGVNDTLPRLKSLLEGLVRIRARPYYIYQAQIVDGTEHLRVPVEQGLDLMRSLRGTTTGFALPQYVLDTPFGKVPLSPNHVVGRHGDHVVVETFQGQKWSEPNPLSGYQPERCLPMVSQEIWSQSNKLSDNGLE
jgi:lysine 2,3-aminomutase